MPQFVRVALITILYGVLSDVTQGQGDLQFRISGPEFEKVASVLLKPRNDYTINGGQNKVQNATMGDLSYELIIPNDLSNISVNHVQIPSDGKMLLTVVSDVLKQTGKLKLSRLSKVDNVLYNGHIDVSLLNVTITALVCIDYSYQIKASSTFVPLKLSNCSVNIDDILVDSKTMQYIGMDVNTDTLRGIFTQSICHSFNEHYSLVFEESAISFDMFKSPITVVTGASYVEIKNGYLVITNAVKTLKKDNNVPRPAVDPVIPFPLPDYSSQPFEIILHQHVLNDLLREFKKELGIGVRDVPLGELLPNLKDLSELDSQGVYMSILFPMVGKKFPDSVSTLVISDADIYFIIKDGSVKVHFDINTTVSVRLNCDTSKTFNALNLSLNLGFPAQIGFDNKFITLNLLTFGGNLTILDSNVGHVIDRGLSTLLYSVPYFASSHLHKLNDMFRGIPLQDVLPKNTFAEVNQISVQGNNLIIGGNLSMTDPKLPRIKHESIQWAGKDPKKELFLIGRDNTPENPEGFELKEVDCKKQVVSSANQQFSQNVNLALMFLTTAVNKITSIF